MTHVACDFTGSFYSSCSSNSKFEELGDKETPNHFFFNVANKRLEKANFLTLKNDQSKSSLVPPNDKKFLVFFWDQRVKIRRNRKGRKPGRGLCVRLEVKITCCAIHYLVHM